jgi:hypothetical protein
VFLKFSFEEFKQGEGIGSTTSKSGDYLFAIKPSDLSCVAFHDGIAQGNLAITAYDYSFASAYREYGSTTILLHLLFRQRKEECSCMV